MSNSLISSEILPRAARTPDSTGSRISLAFVYAFVIGLVLPIEASVFVGPMRLSPYRIVLLVALLPCLFRFLSGGAGKLIVTDVLIILHALWAMAALMATHGLGRVWEPAGIYVIEILVPYFLARSYISSAADFEAFARFALVIIIMLVPVAAYESFTGNFLRNPPSFPEGRLGLQRAWGPFEHPILLGVFCASMLGITFFALRGRISDFGRLVRCGAIGAATFFSLSAGPLTTFVVQVGLIAWNRLMRRVRHRWYLLAGCYAAAWAIVDLLSNRTPVHVFITYFTFNVHNAYNRILIWEYGTAEIARHPFFGIGLSDWARPEWMSNSMDNFWLVEAVRYGLPALILLASAIILLCVRIGRRRGLDPRAANCRTGWMVTIVGLILAGATVHYWNAIFCLFFFLLGSGVWLLHGPVAATAATGKPRRYGRTAK